MLFFIEIIFVGFVLFLALDYNLWIIRNSPTSTNQNGVNRSIFWKYILKEKHDFKINLMN